jgi:hypothetical protein
MNRIADLARTILDRWKREKALRNAAGAIGAAVVVLAADALVIAEDVITDESPWPWLGALALFVGQALKTRREVTPVDDPRL